MTFHEPSPSQTDVMYDRMVDASNDAFVNKREFSLKSRKNILHHRSSYSCGLMLFVCCSVVPAQIMQTFTSALHQIIQCHNGDILGIQDL